MNGPDLIREQSLPGVGLIEAGSGFRIGSPAFDFESVAREGDRWTSVDGAHGLRMKSSLRRQGAAVVIEHRLMNVSDERSPAIDVIEPLHLVFRLPGEAWRHIYAGGGTTEGFYPPTAYRTHEQTRAQLMHRPFLIESHPLGRSSNKHLPMMISLASTAADAEGIFCGLEWSASWYMRYDPADEEWSSLSVGIKINGLRLDPGEELALPPVHLGFFKGGPIGGTNALRRHLYEHVCARYHGELMIPRANYSHWFGIANRLHFGLMKAQAKRAAELGLEVFAVDSSWFPGGFPEGVGNWDQVDRHKFPEGLEPLAEYVRELGMGFGLWFEPERAVEGTDAIQKHREWFVPIPVPSWGKNQFFHLNLAERGAQDWVIETVGGWIERLGLTWSRWDYNIDPYPFWEAVDPTLKIQFKYMEGLYRVLDTLMSDFPDWIVEGCAGGGRRIDIGTMRRAHTFWFSDQTGDPLICRYMQARANRFIPGHLCDSTVAVPLGAGDEGYDDTAVLSRMLGKLAFDGDIASWSPELTQQMAGWVDEFKAIRHLLVQDFFQLLPMPTTANDWDAVQFTSYEGDEAALFVFGGMPGDQQVRLKGLDVDGQYSVSRSPDGDPTTVSGVALQNQGLSVSLAREEGSLWRIHRRA